MHMDIHLFIGLGYKFFHIPHLYNVHDSTTIVKQLQPEAFKWAKNGKEKRKKGENNT